METVAKIPHLLSADKLGGVRNIQVTVANGNTPMRSRPALSRWSNPDHVSPAVFGIDFGFPLPSSYQVAMVPMATMAHAYFELVIGVGNYLAPLWGLKPVTRKPLVGPSPRTF